MGVGVSVAVGMRVRVGGGAVGEAVGEGVSARAVAFSAEAVCAIAVGRTSGGIGVG